MLTPNRRQSKTLILSANVDQKSLETEFSIVICRPIAFVAQLATKCQRKISFKRFLSRVRRSLRAFSIAAYPMWCWKCHFCKSRFTTKYHLPLVLVIYILCKADILKQLRSQHMLNFISNFSRFQLNCFASTSACFNACKPQFLYLVV